MATHRERRTAPSVVIGTLLAIIALAAPATALAADVTVETIPGAGWIPAPDNTAGGSARIVEGPGADVESRGSVELTTAASTDFAGIGRALLQPLSALTGGGWSTYVTGDSGSPVSEAASLRFGMNRLGLTEFTTMTVDPSNNGTVTAGGWQDWTLTDATLVWQTNATGGFCLIASPCTFAAFKAQYPAAAMIGVQAAIGTGVPAVSSYVDGISLTLSGTTDTWDFELPAADASDATIGSATLTATGADVVIDLSASALSVEPRVFTIEVEGQAPQTVTLDPGETTSITVSVPFGTTVITVLTQNVVVATATVTATAAAPSVPASAAVATPPATDTVSDVTPSAPADVRPFLVLLGAVTVVALFLAPKRRSSRNG
jgi:hypothetical protein